MLMHLTTAAPIVTFANERTEAAPSSSNSDLCECGHDWPTHIADPTSADCQAEDCKCVTFKRRKS